MAKTRKWLVGFTTSTTKFLLKEEVCATDWLYAKKLLEAKYHGLKISSYTEIR